MQDPHIAQPILRQGPDPTAARLVVILVHGRNGTAASMLELASQIDGPDIAYLAPQAAGSTWYPYSFLAPMDQNEPGLSSGLAVLERLVHILEQQVAPGRIALLGFSQGACLTLEYAARQPRRYAAIVGLSGGLIGPPGTPRSYPGTFGGAPVFLGCGDPDSHIPLERVVESGQVFERMGAAVDVRIYPQMGHTINADEIEAVNALLRACGPRV
jgi:predicted esterase